MEISQRDASRHGFGARLSGKQQAATFASGGSAISFRKILIAVDSDALAAHAAEIGGELANELRAQLALIHVTDSDPRVASGADGMPDEQAALRKQAGRKLVSDFRRRMSPTRAVFEFIEAGSPADEIVKAARNWPADLIVIGSHGRTGVQRALLGSVAEAVMRQAPCPVLVVRATSGQLTIGLAPELGINVIAEGVETTEQLELLKTWGCREAQGFYFAKPLAPDDVTPLLRRGGILREQPIPAKTAA